MEYYILNEYQKRWKDEKKRLSLISYSKKETVSMRMCFLILTVFFVLFCIVNKHIQRCNNWIPTIVFACVAVFLLIIYEQRSLKHNLKNHIEYYERKIDVLNTTLEKFGVDSEAKLDCIICLFNNYVEEKKEYIKEKRANSHSVIIVILGVIAFFFDGMEKLNININNFRGIVVLLGLVIIWFIPGTFSVKIVDPRVTKYEEVLKDLYNLKFLKYK